MIISFLNGLVFIRKKIVGAAVNTQIQGLKTVNINLEKMKDNPYLKLRKTQTRIKCERHTLSL